MENKCLFCGKPLNYVRGKMFCSRKCYDANDRHVKKDNGLSMARKLLPERKPHKEPDLSIVEVQRRAREMGMTYGQYVSRFGG